MIRTLGPGKVRIIGGRWRGRRLDVPRLPGLRPSPDRVRETLFNWLSPVVKGARCVDLFAGTGALGLEAASRGASSVVLVEQAPRACAALREHVSLLDAGNVRVVQADALDWLERTPEATDIVFLDPPFGQGLLGSACQMLAERKWLAPGAFVYMETELDEPPIPAGWQLHRTRKAGNVRYYLVVVKS